MLHLKGKVMTLEKIIKQTIQSCRATLLVLAVYGGTYITAGLFYVDPSEQKLCAGIVAVIFFFLDALYEGIWGN